MLGIELHITEPKLHDLDAHAKSRQVKMQRASFLELCLKARASFWHARLNVEMESAQSLI